MRFLAALVAAVISLPLTPAQAHGPVLEKRVVSAQRINNSPAASRAYARAQLDPVQYACLNQLWTKESHWRYRAHNKRSGAYGIPQGMSDSLRKMHARQQVDWGLRYIEARYQTPCAAWRHSQRRGWY